MVKELNCSYSVFKQVVANNNLTVYFWTDGTRKGTAFAGTQGVVYAARIVDDTFDDFDTTYPVGTRQDVARHDDAMAQIVGLTEIPQDPPFSQTYGYFPEEAQFQGFLVQASGLDVDTIVDYKIEREIYVKGGWFWTDQGNIGDYGEFSVVDKDNILGLHTFYGLTPGVDVIELGKYVSSQYLNPNGHDWCALEPPNVANVVSGLYMRTKIHTTGEKPVNMGVTYLWFQK